jgi:hypothetical protein
MNTTSNNIKKISSVKAIHTYYEVEHDNKTYLALDVSFNKDKFPTTRKIFYTNGNRMTVNGTDIPIPTEEIGISKPLYSTLCYAITDLIETLK